MDSFSQVIQWVLWTMGLGVASYVIYKINKGEEAEKELILKDYQDEKKDIEEANSKLTAGELVDKNNKRK